METPTSRRRRLALRLIRLPRLWLLAACTVLTLGPLVVVGYISIDRGSDALREQGASRVVTWATLAGRYVGRQMQDAGKLVASYADRVTLTQALQDGEVSAAELPLVTQHLRQLVTDVPEISFAFVTDTAGVGLASYPVDPVGLGKNYSFRDWYGGVSRTWQPYVSSAFAIDLPGDPLVVAVAAPVRDHSGADPASGRVVAYLVAVYSVTSIDQFVDQFSQAEQLELTVTDRQGTFVGGEGDPSRLLQLGGDPGVRSALRGETGSRQTSLAGTAVLAGYAPVPSLGWTVTAVEDPQRSVLTEASHLRTTGYVTTAALALFLLVGLLLLDANLRSRLRAERTIRAANQRLESAVTERTAALACSNRELEAFAYSVSHDLRAPLRGIDGFARLLVEENSAELSDEARRRLHVISRSTRHMGELIDGLLAFSRVGREEIRRQRVSPVEVASRVACDLPPPASGHHLEVSIAPMPDCSCDPVLLERVYANLIGNAAKYSSTREHAVIEVGAASEGAGPGVPVYYVRDNGVGFDMRYSNKLFGVFQRLHSPDDYEGTGVGLALVQRVIHRHGGRIWAEARPGEGATFSFTLPDPGGSTHGAG